MKKILPDICAVAGGLLIGTNIKQLNTIEECISVILGVVLVAAAFIMVRKMK